jgi:hypothetical protein
LVASDIFDNDSFDKVLNNNLILPKNRAEKNLDKIYRLKLRYKSDSFQFSIPVPVIQTYGKRQTSARAFLSPAVGDERYYGQRQLVFCRRRGAARLGRFFLDRQF